MRAEYTDQTFVRIDDMYELVFEEHLRKLKQWGIQTHTIWQWLGYITEELGELSAAIGEAFHRGGDPAEVVHEAIQVATLSLKVAEMVNIYDCGGYVDFSNKPIKNIEGKNEDETAG